MFCSQNYKTIGAVKPYTKWAQCSKAHWFFRLRDNSGSSQFSVPCAVLFTGESRSTLSDRWDESGDSLNVKLPASSSDQFDSGSIMVWRAIFMSGSTNVLTA